MGYLDKLHLSFYHKAFAIFCKSLLSETYYHCRGFHIEEKLLAASSTIGLNAECAKRIFPSGDNEDDE